MTIILPSSDPNKALLQKIEDFLERTPSMSPTRFGLDANGDGALLTNLRDGRSVSLTLGQKLLDFIAEQDAANKAEGGAVSPDSGATAIDQPLCPPSATADADVGEAA
jgi:hypothetical protein